MDNVNTGGGRALTSTRTANGYVLGGAPSIGHGSRNEAQARADAEAKRRAAAEAHARRRERRRKAKWLLTAMLLLFSFVLIYVISRFIGSFFIVGEIIISGDSPYTPQQIIDASGMSIGDSLYRADGRSAEEAISNNLPYILSVDVKIKLPSSVYITVESQSAVMYAEIAGEYYALSGDMRVLERSVSADEFISRGLLYITLPPVGNAVVGSRLTLSNGWDPAYIGEIAEVLENSELSGRIDRLFLDERFNIILSVDGRYRICFGSDQNAADKALAAARVIEAYGDKFGSADLRAEIDVSDPASVVVINREVLDITQKVG